MRTFEYNIAAEKLLSPEIVQMLSDIHEHKGKQDLFMEANVDELKTLLHVAFIQSVDSSNRIEGIHTSDKRLKELVEEKTMPQSRPEQEIAGYRQVLLTIHESYDYIAPSTNIILQMHRDMFSFSKTSTKGKFKDSDNIIAEIDEHGQQRTRFTPVSAFQTPQFVDELCASLSKLWKENTIDKLLLVPMFILDFLCIHPFNDGNGRISRLLTLLLFYKAGYIVGKYISIERLIEDTKETYYEALEASSCLWHENKNNYAPFVKYYLGVLLKAYSEFEDRVDYLKHKKLSKAQRVAKAIENNMGKITKKEILEICPDISKITVERTLGELVKSGQIKKVSAGPKTAYVYVHGEVGRQV